MTSKTKPDLFEGYATSPVPPHIRVNGYRIALINCGLALSLSGLVLGVELGANLGLTRSTVAFVAGGIVLALIAGITGYVGVKVRMSSYMIIRYAFGSRGSNIVNLCMAVSLLGWFGVMASLFAQAAAELWTALTGIALPEWMFIVAGGVLMTAGAMRGFRSLKFLSVLLVPVQLLVLLWLVQIMLTGTSFAELLQVEPAGGITIGDAVSAVIGGWIVGAVCQPDLTRYGKTFADSAIAAAIPFFIAGSFIYVVAAMTGLWSGESDLLPVMIALGMGAAAFVFVLFSSWITNAMNLYGCSLSINAVFRNLREWHIAVASGMLGTALALAGILDRFVDFVFSLGVLFTPVAGIYIVDFFCFRRDLYLSGNTEVERAFSVPAFVAWIAGIGVAVAAGKGWFTLTGTAAIDSLLVTSLLFWTIEYSLKRSTLK
ncbi:MAG: cytosine permease [Proteobacteria bacterium]|nr:cytosine permease [Pseudomonadota bacterium]